MGKIDYHKFSAGLIGTLVLVLMSCGSAAMAGAYGTTGVELPGISFAFGLLALAMMYAVEHISGCQINPAIAIKKHRATLVCEWRGH